MLAMTSGVRDMQRVLDLVWTHLLPVFGEAALPEDAAAQDALVRKLEALSLPVVEGAPSSGRGGTISGSSYAIEPNHFHIERVRFSFDGNSPTVTFMDATGEQPVTAGYGVWRKGMSDGRVLGRERAWSGGLNSERMAASGAWTEEDTFELRVCYTEGEVCPIVRFRFRDGALAIQVDPNVSWDEPTVTTLIGHPAP